MSSWHAKPTGAYARDSQEAKDNGDMVYSILYNSGWTINAIAGLWGNVGGEGGYNPWRWQSDNVQPSDGSPWTNRGYGLVQFTPASKYIDAAYARSLPTYGPNFSDIAGKAVDGNAQILYINEYADYYPTDDYPLSYDAFKVSTESPEYLASAWLYNYERPADPASTEQQRRENARFWFEYFGGHEPPGPGGQLPIWLYFKLARR